MLKLTSSSSIYRYLIVGSLAFLTEYCTFLLLYKGLSVQVYVANSLSFCCGLFVSFFLNRLWTFKSDLFQRRGPHQFMMYSALAGMNLLLTNVIIGMLRSFGVTPLLGKIAAMVCIACWNFFIFKLVIFKSHRA